MLIIEGRREKRSCPLKLGGAPFTRGSTSRRPWWVGLRHSIPHIAYPFMANSTCTDTYTYATLVHSFPSITFTFFFRERGHVSSLLLLPPRLRCVSNLHTTYTNFRDVCYTYRQLHILTRDAKRVLSPRNHVSCARASPLPRRKFAVFYRYKSLRFIVRKIIIPIIYRTNEPYLAHFGTAQTLTLKDGLWKMNKFAAAL